MKQFDTVIVSGGNIQDGFALDFLNKIIKDGSQVRFLAADKGLEFYIRRGMVPAEAIGDFDSAAPEVFEYLREHPEIRVHRLKPEKDDSDTQSALRLAAERGAEKVLLLGCLGTRMDHMIANMGLLLMGKTLGLEVTMVDNWNQISLAPSGTVLRREEQFGKYTSFFALGGPVEGLTLTGFRYPLKEHCLRMEDAGLTVSNEICETEAKINYRKGNLLMIQSRD